MTTEGEQLAQIIAKAFPNTNQDTWTHDDLQAAVRQSQTEWQTKERIGKGKPQKVFHTCLGKLDAHSELFKFIPSGDKYFTLITGAVTTLVKVSRNMSIQLIHGLAKLCISLISGVTHNLEQKHYYSGDNLPIVTVSSFTSIVKY